LLRPEVYVNTHVDFARAQPKPASVTTLKPGRFLLLNHSQEPHEECARFVLPSRRDRE